MKRLVPILAIILMLNACLSEMDLDDRDQNLDTTTSTQPVPRGTVEGLVLAGPICPVETNPPDPACADRPVAGAILLIVDAAGDEAERVVTDSDGSFSISLPAGTYQIEPQPVEGYQGTAETLTVDVAAGTTGPVTLTYDTGIR